MEQKYKVFIDELVVFFSKNKIPGLVDLTNVKVNSKKELKHLLGNKNAFVRSNSPYNSINLFFNSFQFIEAGGGIVERENTFLMIYRNNIWDLPKGKVEKSDSSLEETSKREVLEECGLTEPLIIKDKLPSTFHIYDLNDRSFIKETHWFHMTYLGSDSGFPQKEEGIEKLNWFSRKQFLIKGKKSFPSIADLIYNFM